MFVYQEINASEVSRSTDRWIMNYGISLYSWQIEDQKDLHGDLNVVNFNLGSKDAQDEIMFVVEMLVKLTKSLPNFSQPSKLPYVQVNIPASCLSHMTVPDLQIVGKEQLPFNLVDLGLISMLNIQSVIGRLRLIAKKIVKHSFLSRYTSKIPDNVS